MEQPGFEPAFGAEGVPVFQDPKEDILHEVLCNSPAARHLCKEIEQRAVVPLEQQAQFFHIAILGGEHDVFVRYSHTLVRTVFPEKGYTPFGFPNWFR